MVRFALWAVGVDVDQQVAKQASAHARCFVLDLKARNWHVGDRKLLHRSESDSSGTSARALLCSARSGTILSAQS